MNSLEWINKQIANIIDVIEVNQIRLDENQLFELLKEHYQAYHKELVELLQTLEQIKDILEAWEVCMNDNSILYVIQALAEGESIDWHRLPEEKQIKLKKALEVKENA